MTTWTDLDDALEAAGEHAITPAEFAALPAPWLPSGFFTLTAPDGSHRTFRVRLDRRGIHSGKRTLALLIGPDGATDYETQGTVTGAGFAMFKRFKSGKSAAHAAILWRLAQGEAVDGWGLLVSKRCRVCNRPLTTPDSLAAEIGPDCRKAVGL